MPIDTDVLNYPIVFSLYVGGKLEDFWDVPAVRLLNVQPANPKLDLSAQDGQVMINHVHLEPNESLQIVFEGYFTVDLDELANNRSSKLPKNLG
jgi:hypothetical protein